MHVDQRRRGQSWSRDPLGAQFLVTQNLSNAFQKLMGKKYLLLHVLLFMQVEIDVK